MAGALRSGLTHTVPCRVLKDFMCFCSSPRPAGHVHTYYRTCNAREERCTEDGSGMVHYVIGTAGHKLSDITEEQVNVNAHCRSLLINGSTYILACVRTLVCIVFRAAELCQGQAATKQRGGHKCKGSCPMLRTQQQVSTKQRGFM